MKICIWITKIFDLGGTKRVVSLLANELVKEHEVTIMTYEDRFREDRTMYHLSEDINVDFIDNSQFVNKHHTPAFCARYLVKKLNDRSGLFNKKSLNPILAEAIFPKKTREKWVEYFNSQDYDVILTTASLSLRLAMIAPRLKAATIGWQHNCYDGYLHVKPVVFWQQENLLQQYLPNLDRYIVLSDYDKRDYMEKLGIDCEVKINPRSFVSEKKCDVKSKRFLMATRFVYAKGLDLMMESFEEFSYNEHLTGNTSFIETTKTVITPQSWNRLELSGRHTTISMMKEHSIDETTIKKIVGHSGAMTLTERVYTHLDILVLIDAINKIVGERENGKEKNKQKKADTDNAIIITHICFSYLYLFTLNLAT